MSFSGSAPTDTVSAAASKRTKVRRRCLLAAKISFDKGLTQCECEIRNISESGARLKIGTAVSLPRFFHLFIFAQQRRLHAELKWRSESEAGIQFCDEAADGASSDYRDEDAASLRRRIRELEAEVGRLHSRIAQLTESSI